MITYIQATQFEILDSSINGDAVFDQLVKVRHTLTQEEGYLLCSHYSNWPISLISQATWLAGCYTPTRWAEDPRLVFGNIPNYQINWSVNTQERSIVLSTGSLPSVTNTDGVYGDEDGLGREVTQLPVQSWDLPSALMTSKIKAVKRLLLSGNRELSKYNQFKVVSQYLLSGQRFVAAEWCYVAAALELWDGYDLMLEEISTEIGYFDWRWFYDKETEFGCLTFAVDQDDYSVEIVSNSESPLPYFIYEEDESKLYVQSSVSNAAQKFGYSPAVGLTDYWVDHYGEMIVVVDCLESGLALAWNLNTKAPDGHAEFLRDRQ